MKVILDLDLETIKQIDSQNYLHICFVTYLLKWKAQNLSVPILN